jgi:hypothetical protein
MERSGSLLCSQDAATDTYPESDEFSPQSNRKLFP